MDLRFYSLGSRTSGLGPAFRIVGSVFRVCRVESCRYVQNVAARLFHSFLELRGMFPSSPCFATSRLVPGDLAQFFRVSMSGSEVSGLGTADPRTRPLNPAAFVQGGMDFGVWVLGSRFLPQPVPGLWYLLLEVTTLLSGTFT